MDWDDVWEDVKETVPTLLIGSIGSSIALVSIIKRGYDIDLYGAAAIIYAGYEWVREFILWPVPVHVTTKDYMAAYAMIGLPLTRTERANGIGEMIAYTLFAAVTWPFVLLYIGWRFITFDWDDADVQVLAVWSLFLLTIVGLAGMFFGLNYLLSP